MNTIRRQILASLAAAPFANWAQAKPRAVMPTLFIGHGSPLNALANNPYTQALTRLGQTLPEPRAILVVSAHWMTQGYTAVLGSAQPPTIHDFHGFPPALHEMEYPAAGHPELARRAQALLGLKGRLSLDWGLDHGTWTVLHHMYPQANIPVFQVSLDMRQSGQYHLAMGQALAELREEGVLIVGSGNIVHNLRRLGPGRTLNDWASEAWAQAFDDTVSAALSQREDQRLLVYDKLPGGQESVPTPDHYWPLLYALGAASKGKVPTTVFSGFQSGTISMRCLQFS